MTMGIPVMKLKKRNRSPSAPPVVHNRTVSRVIHTLLTKLGDHGPHPREITPGGRDLPPFEAGSGFASDYLICEIFSKFDDGKSSTEKVQAALSKFLASEEQCRQTNERLRNIMASSEYFHSGSVQSLLWSAARKIQGVLGPLCWDEAAVHFDFGPGATTRLPRVRSSKVQKFSGRPDTTVGNAALANAAIMQYSPLWTEGLLWEEESGYCNLVPGNRITTVPKNYKTDRCIAIEPCMNMFIQKGLGGVIRSRLRKVGVNLNDQSLNQDLAAIGSKFENLATIDLSSASDTVSHEIVRQLLPPDWLCALEQCRSFKGVLPSGETIVYQKFSSMGNGYTFELESLIFWALCSAVIDYLKLKDTRIAVYGDDIIVPSAAVPLVIETLSVCGFSTNLKKTHTSGPFRESCGKHFISGVECTPFYVRRPVRTLSDLFLLHNNLKRWSVRTSLNPDQRLAVDEALEGLKKCAPTAWRKPRIPDGYGDGAFIGSFDECTPQRAPNGLEGFVVTILADVTEYREFEGPGRLTASLFYGFDEFGWGPARNPFKPRQIAGGESLPPRKRAIKTLVQFYT